MTDDVFDPELAAATQVLEGCRSRHKLREVGERIANDTILSDDQKTALRAVYADCLAAFSLLAIRDS